MQASSTAGIDALPVAMVEAVDISSAIRWLVSGDARYVTGGTVPVDAGFTNSKCGGSRCVPGATPPVDARAVLK